MAFKKVGDWGKVTRLVNELGKEALRAQRLSLMRWGLKAEAIAKLHISKQDLNWAELNPDYLAKKVREGKSENILVATSTYFGSITSYVLSDAAYAGVRKNIVDDKGIEIANIAAVLEYGSPKMGIPERPLWKPTLIEVTIWHAKYNTPEQHFVKNLKKYT